MLGSILFLQQVLCHVWSLHLLGSSGIESDLVLTALTIPRCVGQGFCRMPLNWGLLDVFLLMVTAPWIMTFLYILLPSSEIERAWRHRTGSFLSSKGGGGRKG